MRVGVRGPIHSLQPPLDFPAEFQRQHAAWWSSAVNRVRLSLRAALRTPSKSLKSLIRLCVRGAVACPMFSLVGCLPSMPSAGGCPPWFGHFVGSTQPSDSLPAYMLDFWLTAFSNRPAAFSGHGHRQGLPVLARGVSMHAGVSDCAESAGRLR